MLTIAHSGVIQIIAPPPNGSALSCERPPLYGPASSISTEKRSPAVKRSWS